MFKSHSVTLPNILSRGKNRKTISNQRTLIGVLCRLMEGQKLILCVIRIIGDHNKQSSFPFAFKLDEKSIPEKIVPYKIHPRNFIEIQLQGCEAINACVIAIGDDSKELIQAYKIFLEKLTSKILAKVPPYQNRITYWCSIDEISVKSVRLGSLPATPQKSFDDFWQRVEKLKRRKASRSSQAQGTIPSAVIDIDENTSDQESEDSDSDYQEEIQLEKASTSRIDTKKKIPPNEQMNKSLKKLKDIASIDKLDETSKIFFMETYKIFKILVHISEGLENVEFIHSFSSDPDAIRIIPEEDETKDLDSKTTLIEGIFPISTRKYKLSYTRKFCKGDEFGPLQFLSNIIRFAWPNHWIQDVTLRGSGENKSRIEIWNHKDPLSSPPIGPVEIGLGEKRLRALIDHVVRKTGKKSYDKVLEKAVGGQICKSMHYRRTKIITTRKIPKKQKIRADEKLPNSSSANWASPSEVTCFDNVAEYLSSEDEDRIPPPASSTKASSANKLKHVTVYLNPEEVYASDNDGNSLKDPSEILNEEDSDHDENIDEVKAPESSSNDLQRKESEVEQSEEPIESEPIDEAENVSAPMDDDSQQNQDSNNEESTAEIITKESALQNLETESSGFSEANSSAIMTKESTPKRALEGSIDSIGKKKKVTNDMDVTVDSQDTVISSIAGICASEDEKSVPEGELPAGKEEISEKIIDYSSAQNNQSDNMENCSTTDKDLAVPGPSKEKSMVIESESNQVITAQDMILFQQFMKSGILEKMRTAGFDCNQK